MASGTPAYEEITQLLRDEIISGRLAQGSRLTTAAVAKRYSVSQMPVREAFHRLRGEGLVTMIPHRGARVRSVDIKLVENIYDIRGVIEGLLARLSAPNLCFAVLSRLQRMNEEMHRAAMENDIGCRLSIDKEFHSTIYRHAGNDQALEICETSFDFLHALRRRYGYDPDQSARILALHSELLGALRDNDGERIEDLARQHTLCAKEDLLQRMRNEAKSTVTV